MAERQLTLPGPVVKKSNALARARWAPESVVEPRLVALVASRVNKDDIDFQTYDIPAKEILGTAVDGRSYKRLSDAADNLLSRVVNIPRPRGFAKCNIFSWCEYDPSSGFVRVRFDPGLKSHYLDLNAYFTEYALFEFLSLPSTYSQIMFEFLKSWDDQPETTVDLKDLFNLLAVPDSFKKDFRNFRLRVLEKAHKDIHAKTSLKYEWEPIKQGKAVVAIRFVFSGGKRKAVKDKMKEAVSSRTSETNNKLFMDAIKCFQSGVCDFKQGSKKCATCKKFNK